MKKFVCLLLVLILGVPAVACGTDDSDDIDPTKTQLYIGIIDGGLGDAWINDLAAGFEELYKDYQGEGDKVGVQVKVDKQKEQFRGGTLINNVAHNRQDIYFTEQIDYYQWVSRGLMLDVTDIVTGDLTAFGEEGAIEGKMHDADIAYLKYNEKYYALPFYSGYMTISYDVDLFEQNLLYFDDDGNFVTSLEDKSLGQDGRPRTYDDGLPLTYEQFFRLCARIRALGMVPINWAGGWQLYMTQLARSLYVDYEGYAQTMLNFNPVGTVDNYVTSVVPAADGNYIDTLVTQSEPINGDESKIFRQAGRYYALSFVENIVRNDFAHTLSFSPSEDFLTAQETFLYSTRRARADDVAMFIDGSWWYNEADGVFTDMATAYPNSSADERRIGVMPYPKATEEQLDQPTSLLMENEPLAFINAAIEPNKIDLAKAFMQYAATDAALVRFTEITGVARAFKYEMPEDILSGLNTFKRTSFEFLSSAEIVNPYTNTDYYRENADGNMWFYTTVNGQEHSTPSTAFRNYTMTVEDYFNGLHQE